MSMFCYQCEQTSQGAGCFSYGVCGKDPETSALQDLLVAVAEEIGSAAWAAREKGVKDSEIDRFVIQALFVTVTNVNFDAPAIREKLLEGLSFLEEARTLAPNGAASPLSPAVSGIKPESSLRELTHLGESLITDKRIARRGETIVGLEDLLLFGVKGMAAYMEHAAILHKESDRAYAFVHEALAALTRGDAGVDELLGLCLRCGEVNLEVMGLLDAAHTGRFGHPVPTSVPVTAKKGKAILVSGHDLADLEVLLKMTDGTGVNVYTHGEMLPAHGYPGLKKYAHLVGNYGGAWQDQREEFEAFPGAILMTTNCIQKPKEEYQARIFTTGLVGWPGVTHVPHRRFGPVIEAALAAPGFPEDETPVHEILVGFGHNAILQHAGTIIDAVKAGALKHFFLVGGCDGAKSGRNYYTEFAQAVPKDCVVLTLACGKFRFNKLDFGTLGGLPRLIDCGQCNDAYTAIKVAGALAEAFGCSVNDLPLSLVLSWYEQKAVCILLTLLHLGIKDIRLGPSLPAFVRPEALAVLVEKFAIKPITTPRADLEAILGKA